MAIDKSRYPADWKAISKRIRFERAKGLCEWCGAPNGKLIIRSSINPARYIIFDEKDMVYTRPDGQWIKATEVPDEFDITAERYTRVWLTVHHIGVEKPDGTPGDPDDKMDVRDENLAALCSRCHLLADQPLHIRNRKATWGRKRRAAKAEAGQLSFLD